MSTPIPDWISRVANEQATRLFPTVATMTDVEIRNACAFKLECAIADAHSRADKRLKAHGQPASPVDVAAAVDALNWVNQLREEKATLRRALVGLVGVNTAKELDEMENVMRSLPAPDEDKAAMLNAIRALKETL